MKQRFRIEEVIEITPVTELDKVTYKEVTYYYPQALRYQYHWITKKLVWGYIGIRTFRSGNKVLDVFVERFDKCCSIEEAMVMINEFERQYCKETKVNKYIDTPNEPRD